MLYRTQMGGVSGPGEDCVVAAGGLSCSPFLHLRLSQHSAFLLSLCLLLTDQDSPSPHQDWGDK